MTVARLKNCRRLTPSASGSGGDHGIGATSRAGTIVVPYRATEPWASTSRAGRRGLDDGLGGPGLAAERSRSRVSPDSAPAPRTSDLRASVTKLTAAEDHDDPDGDGDDGC